MTYTITTLSLPLYLLPILAIVQRQRCCHAFGASAANKSHNSDYYQSGSVGITTAVDVDIGTTLRAQCENKATRMKATDNENDDGQDQDGVNSDSSKSEPFRIGYLSDIEGNWEYFLECVKRSNVLEWEETHPPSSIPPNINNNNEAVTTFQRLTLSPNTKLIYGGDTVDKGTGDIRLVRALVSLKKRYPTRVHLLVGNRDLNKLRLSSELSESDMKIDFDDGDDNNFGKPFWNNNAKSLKEYLEELREEQGANASLDELNTRAERLRYMFQHTLGCPDTFEFRREEIRVLAQTYGEYPAKSDTHDVTPIQHAKEVDILEEPAISIEISDDQVVDSFLYEMSPEGSLRQYLHLSSIAAIVGNTIFVHGAIDRLTMKYVPSPNTKFELPRTPPPSFTAPHTTITPPDGGRIVESVHEWVQSLNEYLQTGMDDYSNRPMWNEDRTSRGGEAVLAIQCRPAMWGRSVVCNSYADGGVITTTGAQEVRKQALQTAQEQLDPLVFEGISSNVMDHVPANWLLEHGIRRIVVGHKPTGDCPAVLSSKYTGVETVAVDTSFSNRKDLNDDENSVKRFGKDRGRAVATVEITGEDAFRNRLETSGVLACGTEYSNQFPILSSTRSDDDDDDVVGDPHIGSMVSNGWWIKAAVPPNYHLCRGSGRFLEYDTRLMEDVINDLRQQS